MWHHRWRIRYARTQPHVRSSGIVMANPRLQHGPQMRFSQRNQPIEALPAKGPDHSFANRIGLGTSRWRFQHRDAALRDRLVKLVGDVGLRARELLREIARSLEMTIYAGEINRDHVHLLISIPPNVSVSRAVQFLKGKSSHRLLSEYAVLRKRYWGQHLWARGYWVASSGNVTDEVWKKYIEDQKPEEPDDDFKVILPIDPKGRSIR